mgnify:CR=1 FL=1
MILFPSIPASFSQVCNLCCVIWRVRPLKTSPSQGSPQSLNASSLIGKVLSTSVFSERNRMHHPPSAAFWIFSQRSPRISLMRSPVRQLNNDAALSTGTLQGVSARAFSSSNVRNCRLFSIVSILSNSSLTSLRYICPDERFLAKPGTCSNIRQPSSVSMSYLHF